VELGPKVTSSLQSEGISGGRVTGTYQRRLLLL
jgi:hypothetical protein